MGKAVAGGVFDLMSCGFLEAICGLDPIHVLSF